MFADDCKGIRALKLGHSSADRLEQILYRVEMMMNAMCDDLGVRLRGKHVALPLQLFTQLFVVLDDPVVDDHETIERNVRVSVALARNPVRRPPCMGDADFSGRRRLLERLPEHFHLADSA